MIQADSKTGSTAWPRKFDLFGVGVSATDYDEAVDVTIGAARISESAIVSLHAVHAIVTASGDADLCRQVNTFQMVAPDGQPVRWALNRLYGVQLEDRVYGPEFMLRLCSRAAVEDVPIYLYGGSPAVLEQLEQNLLDRYPRLRVAGTESPPFRCLTAAEDEAVVCRINDSGARLLFIGLGCPKQDRFAYEHADSIHAVQVCVGAAFDFHAGNTRMAPEWMQRCGLEWLFRLIQEPRRLWRRYAVTNSIFLAKFALAWCGISQSASGPDTTVG